MKECKTCKHLETEPYCRFNPPPSFSGEHLWCRKKFGEPPLDEREAQATQHRITNREESCDLAEPWVDPEPNELLSTSTVERSYLETFYIHKCTYEGSGHVPDGLVALRILVHVVTKARMVLDQRIQKQTQNE